MAKRLKLTEERKELICKYISEGMTQVTAAKLAGIAESTFYNWLARGRESKSGIYKEFAAAVEEAEARNEYKRVKRITKAAEDDWKADAWYLERRYPERYGKTDRLAAQVHHAGEVTNKNELHQRVEIQHKLSEDEQQRELLKKLYERQKATGDR